MNNTLHSLSPQQLAQLGGGVLGYVREIETAVARKLLGKALQLPDQAKLYCLYNADGSPISISATHDAAIGSALEHDLLAASVH